MALCLVTGSYMKPEDTAESTPIVKPKINLPPEMEARKWQKGQSGNPGGRPKGLVTRIKELTNGGEDIFECLVGAMKGTLPAREGETKGESVKAKERIQAATILAHYAFGKPVETTVQVKADEETIRNSLSLNPEMAEALARYLLQAPAPKLVEGRVIANQTSSVAIQTKDPEQGT